MNGVRLPGGVPEDELGSQSLILGREGGALWHLVYVKQGTASNARQLFPQLCAWLVGSLSDILPK